MTPGRSHSGARRRLLLTLLLVAMGAALLVWQVRALDVSAVELRGTVAAIGFWFAAVLALSLARFALRAYAWIVLTDRRLPLGRVLAATISGDALGNVTPLGMLASEPAKALYLRQAIEPAHALAALAAENFFYSVSVALYVVAGTGAMLALFPLEPDVVRAGQLALGAMAAVLAGAAWLAWQRPTVVSRLLERLPVVRTSPLVGRVRAFEQAAYGAAGHRGTRLVVVAACEAAFHALSFIECWMIYALLTGVTSLLPALIFDAFNRVANVEFKIVPLRLGVEEAGTAIVAGAIGYPPASGLLLAIVRKVRVIVWAAVGLILWSRRALAPAPASPNLEPRRAAERER